LEFWPPCFFARFLRKPIQFPFLKNHSRLKLLFSSAFQSFWKRRAFCYCSGVLCPACFRGGKSHNVTVIADSQTEAQLERNCEMMKSLSPALRTTALLGILGLSFGLASCQTVSFAASKAHGQTHSKRRRIENRQS
jgi:hypothetical protein